MVTVYDQKHNEKTFVKIYHYFTNYNCKNHKKTYQSF